MQTAAIALIVVLIVAMALGFEITWALGLACITAVLLDPKLTFVVISQRIFANSNSFSMLAIPAFMLAGDIMSKGGLSENVLLRLRIPLLAGSQAAFLWCQLWHVRFLQQSPVLPLRRPQRLVV